MKILKAGKRLLRNIALLYAAMILLAPVLAQAQGSLELFEQKIKAGLVYNFLKYTTWPDVSANENLRVCLYGGDPFDGFLDPLNGRTAQQATIKISKIYSLDESDGCHLVCIHKRKKDDLMDILAFLSGRNVLTISDIDDFALRGGMVEIATEQNQIRLYINVEAINSVGLSVQDRILKLAKLVSE